MLDRLLLAAGASSGYWMGTLSGGNNDIGKSVALDSAGNVYTCGYSDAGGVDRAILAKYTPQGTLVWQKYLTNGAPKAIAVAIDSSDNVYVAGYHTGGSGGQDGFLVKYDTSGNISWQQKLYTSGNDYVLCMTVDATGNIYLGGYTDYYGYYTCFLVKYNSSGALQWHRDYYNDFSQNSQVFGITADNSSNVYIVGYYYSGYAWRAFVAKHNSSGALQWQRGFYNASNYNAFAYGVGTDSSGNVYVTGRLNAPSDTRAYVFKYDSSGTLLWQRQLYSASGNIYGKALSVDAAGNSYITMSNDIGGTAIGLAKYDSSGALQWQRRMGTGGDEAWIYANSTNAFYLTGNSYFSGNGDIFFAKLPSAGTMTGAYTVNGNSIVYSSTSYTDAAGALSLLTPNQTSANGSFASTTASLGGATSTLTSSVTQL